MHSYLVNGASTGVKKSRKLTKSSTYRSAFFAKMTPARAPAVNLAVKREAIFRLCREKFRQKFKKSVKCSIFNGECSGVYGSAAACVYSARISTDCTIVVQ